jgi:Tol biopolymer transport system component
MLVVCLALAVALALVVELVAKPRPAEATFPGTNGRIAFVEHGTHAYEGGPDPIYKIKLVRPDGSGLSTLYRAKQGQVLSNAAVSPRGTGVAYAKGGGERAKNTEIYKINIRSKTITRITNNAVFDGNPAWSPSGGRIAFERRRTIDGVTDTDIFVRRSDGTGKPVHLTKTPNIDEYAPAWSPNGKEIAFHTRGATQNEARDIVVMNLDSRQRRNLTNDGYALLDESPNSPNWSPDGSRIVFDSSEDSYGMDGVYTMNAQDGSDKQLLAKGYISGGEGAVFAGATYSPDGKKIAYVRTERWDIGDPIQDSALYKMNTSDGSQKQRIYSAGGGPGTTLGEDLYYPDWGNKVTR